MPLETRTANCCLSKLASSSLLPLDLPAVAYACRYLLRESLVTNAPHPVCCRSHPPFPNYPDDFECIWHDE